MISILSTTSLPVKSSSNSHFYSNWNRSENCSGRRAPARSGVSASPDQEDHTLWWRHTGDSYRGPRRDASKGQPARGQLELDATLVSSGNILLLDYKMFLVQVHPLKEERSRRRSMWCQSLKSGKSSSTETTRFTWPTGHWRISPEYSIDNDWTFSSGIECHNRIV